MRKAALAIVVTVLAGLGWTGLWVYGAHVAGGQLQAWLVREAEQGRIWSCPNRTIGGYPFALSVTCTNATFAGRALGQEVEASVAGVDAEISIVHPSTVAVVLGPPFAYRTSDKAANVAATWSALTLDLVGLPTVERAALNGRDIAIRGDFGDAGQQDGKATILAASFFAVGQSDPAADFHVAITGASIPALDAVLGGTAPVDADLTGRIEHVAVGPARTPAEAIDRWRRAGGVLDLAPSRLARAGSRVTAQGQLALDAEHRPQGHLDADFVGLAPILKRYGVDGNLAAIGSLFSTILGSPARQPSEPGAVALPIRFRNGHLGIGPIVTPVALLPLY